MRDATSYDLPSPESKALRPLIRRVYAAAPGPAAWMRVPPTGTAMGPGWARATPRPPPRNAPVHLTFSGANVAIVVTGVLVLLRRRAVDRRIQAVVALLALAGFALLARPSASV